MPRNPNLRPNVEYNCTICGQHVAKYINPSDWPKHRFLYCSLQCKGKAQAGAKHPMWKGGRRVTDQGYILVYRPDHPYCDAKGLVREHRLVMEAMLGRYLRPEEIPHHKNDNPSDNRPDNLQLFANQAEHKAFEMAERRRNQQGQLVPVGA